MYYNILSLTNSMMISNHIELDPLIDFPVQNKSLADENVALSVMKMVTVNIFWFSYQLFWFLLLIVIMPKHIEMIMGNEWVSHLVV